MSGLHERPVGEALWRAGAGAGKTYNLVLRVMRIAEEWAAKNDGALPRLVVTTFTRMATQELRVRLMEAALRAADEGRKELIPFVTSRSQLFVTTLHGVMDSYLRSFGSEIGLEPGFRVGGSEEISAMVRRVGKKVLFPAAAEEQLATDVDVLLSEFDFSTTLALLMRVSRIQAEFDGSDQPARPASKHEMIDSMQAHLMGTAPAVLALRAEICAAGPHPKWQPYADWLLKIVKALETNKSEAALDERAFRTRIESLLELLSDEPSIRNVGEHKIEFDQGAKWKNAWKDLQEIAESVLGECDSLEKFELVNAALARVEQNFSRVLREEKFRQGLIELEDLEILALELVRKFPESAKTYAEGWDHWLIDEYQDTSPRQVQLIQALAQERPQFVVGDPQQSIYMFRGARPHVFLERERKANAESHEVVGLQGNRRSHPEVMAFINEAVERLGDEFQEMTAERANMENHGRRETSQENPFGAATFLFLEEPMAADDAGKLKPLKAEEQRRLEAKQIGRAIGSMLDQGVSPASIAVLARSNRDLVIVARELALQKRPFQIHTAGAYSDRLEVSDLSALLGFMSNPHDDENLIHLARTPWFPIDEETLAGGYRREGSLWSSLETRGASSDSCHEIEALQSVLLAARERGIVQAFREALTACDFFAFCGAMDPSGRREANALKFLARLTTAERQAGFVPRKFIDEIQGRSDRGQEGESSDRDAVAAAKPDRIHLMTIHVSKGLEFDHVFLPFLSEKGKRNLAASDFVFHETKRLWNVGIALGEDSKLTAGTLADDWAAVVHRWGIEEQKRLLYVALTRARESLFLSATGDAGDGSFLEFLKLSVVEGVHEHYKTVTSLANEAQTDDSKLLRESGAHTSEIPAPWSVGFRMVDGRRVSEPGKLANISVTSLLELEDQGLLASGMIASTARGAKKDVEKDATREAPSAKRALSMAAAAARGTRLHRVFELAKFALAGASTVDIEAMALEITRWFKHDEQETARAALRWLLELKQPNLSEVLTNGEAEWSFTFVKGGFAIDGQIDLWGRDGDGRLWVVDYKTGDPSYHEKAMRQLGLYADALLAGKRTRADENGKIETAFLAAVYPFSEEVYIQEHAFQEGR